MKSKKALTVFICCALLLCAMTAPFAAFAQGENNIYDAGGFAGGGDWGGGSDSGWSDSGSSWSSYDSDGSGDSSGSPPAPLLIIIIAVILYMVIKNISKGRTNSQNTGGFAPVGGQARGELSELVKKDPLFSKEAFLEGVGNLYVQLQNAWQAKDLSAMRGLMTDAIYNQFARQLKPYIDAGQTNVVDRITVLSKEIVGYRQDESNDILTVRLQTRIVDYVIDDRSGNIIRGDDAKELFMTYDWTMVRDKNMQTLSQEGVQHVSCPSCGAPLELKASAKCEYCGTVVTASAHDWLIADIRGISQRGA